MRAEVKTIEAGCSPSCKVELVFNYMEPIYVEHHQATKKYKKVGKEAKAKLLKCIQKGWSIINV